MANEFENDDAKMGNENELSAKEHAFLNAVHQRKVVAEALKNGTLCCLPGENGYADTQPAMNVQTEKIYHGANLLVLKAHQKEGGFPTGEYITGTLFEKARKDDPDFFIRKGQKGVTISFSEKNEETNEWEDKHVRLFNIAQTSRPDKLRDWAKASEQEKQEERNEYKRSQYGTNWEPHETETKQENPDLEIVCSSTEPEKYLGQYLAAVSLGGKFKASDEQAKEFAETMGTALYATLLNKENGEPVLGKEGQPVSNPFSLLEISRKASQECRDIRKELRMEAQKQEQPEQKLEQSRGRGM